MRLATKAGRAAPMAVRPQETPGGALPPGSGGLPPAVIQQVATKRGADGGAELPIKGSQQIMIQDVSIDTHVVLQLLHDGTLFGGHHVSGGVVNAVMAVRFSSQARTDSQACVDLFARARRTVIVSWTCGVPAAQKHARALRWTEALGGALVAMHSTAAGGPEGGQGGVHGAKPPIERPVA